MVVIPAGSFEMGSNESANEQPVHLVNVPGFLLGKTEVTQGQWKALMGNNPSRFSQCGDDCPVEQVSWNEAQEFALRLSRKTGKKYRLPSEAEWEYAARAGSSGTWSFGDDETQVGDHAWHNGNSQGKAQRVAQKRPNGFGLFDMHGNVWEWVEDCFQSNYSGAPTDGSAWTTAGSVCFRVLRGGSWFNLPSGLRSAVRNRYSPVILNVDYGGLRLARSAVATPQSTLGSSPLPAAGATAPQASSPTDSYSARLVAHIRPNITFRPDLAGIVGNPGAEVEVRAYADGTIISRKLLKSSGVKAWDEAVLKAIDKTDTLPRDIDGRVPSDFVFTFRPKDQQDLVAERLAQKLESERIAVYAQQKLAHGREAAAPAEETCPFPPVNTGSDTPTPAKWTSPAVIYFDQDSFAIKPESESVVKTHARLLLVETARRVVLEGHTEISVGREYGLAIGQKRAEAVRRALTCLGVPENQVDAVSLGTEKTAVQGTDDASHAKNRRVEIRYR
jgi:TonB family protein